MPLDKEFLERFYDKQEQMANDLSDIKVLLAKQEENLKLHMYRTELAEESIKLLREELKPLEYHVWVVNIALKGLGVLSLLAGFAVSIIKIIQYLR